VIALKRTVVLLTVTVLAALSLHAVSAQDASSVGVAADHPLYDAKLAGESGVEGLAPSEAEEAKAKLQHADKRVAEMDKLSQEGKGELAEETGNDYSEKMQEVNDLGSTISDLAQKQKIDELVATARSVVEAAVASA
jgi:hypothetical protein